MPAPTTVNELLELTRKSGIVEDARLDPYIEQLIKQNQLPTEPSKLAGLMVRDAIVTLFQAEQLLAGKWKRFTIGKYKVLEKLGAGGMGQVFLCEHTRMRRRVAVKVLQIAKADEPSSLERFHREARLVAALDHVNIVRAYDIDQDENLHFLVMEYVDGPNLQEMVKRFGPMDVLRACHYMYQSALGLQHASDAAGIIHRDIKPGNILVDRKGVVKILDMGLARFFHDNDDLLTKRYDETVLGTADYLAPEQAIDSHAVDIRADIYSLGATFYYLLTGQPPFTEGTVAQKLLWHQNKQPKPILEIRSNVPKDVIAIVEKMMAKNPSDRYQMPREVAEALAPIVATPIPPPPEFEMPQLSPASMGVVPTFGSPSTRAGGPPTPRPASRNTSPTAPATPTPATKSRPPAPAPIPREAAPTVVLANTTQPKSAPKSGSPFAAPRPSPAPGTEPSAQTHVREEAPIWETIAAAETPKPNSHADTARTPYRSPTAKTQATRVSAAKQLWQRTPRWAIYLAGGAVLGIVFVIVLLLLNSSKRDQAPQQPTTPVAAAANQTWIVDPATNDSNTSGNVVKGLFKALNLAKTGDRILVRGPAIEEPQWAGIEANHFAKGVTIEADMPAGQLLTWRLAASAKDSSAILNVGYMEGLTFKGFLFDGQNRADAGIHAVARCAGVTFENCRVQNCKVAAVRLDNAAGEPGRPFVFSHIRFDGTANSKAVIYLHTYADGTPSPGNRQIKFEDCIFNGPATALALIEGSGDSISFVNNRFFQATDGVVVRPLKDGRWSDIAFSDNAFDRLARNAVSIEGLPAGASEHTLVFERNQFAKCKTVCNVASDKPVPGLLKKNNFRDAASAEGNGALTNKIEEPKWHGEDPNDEKHFLRRD